MNRKFSRVQFTQQPEEANSETSNQASKQPLLKYRMNKSLLRNHFVPSKEELSTTEVGQVVLHNNISVFSQNCLGLEGRGDGWGCWLMLVEIRETGKFSD